MTHIYSDHSLRQKKRYKQPATNTDKHNFTSLLIHKGNRRLVKGLNYI